MLNEGIPFTVPTTESSCSSSHSTKRGSRAAQRRHVATKKEGGLLAEEGERERGAHRLSILFRLTSPSRSTSPEKGKRLSLAWGVDDGGRSRQRRAPTWRPPTTSSDVAWTVGPPVMMLWCSAPNTSQVSSNT